MSFPKKGKFFPKRGDPNSSNGAQGNMVLAGRTWSY